LERQQIALQKEQLDLITMRMNNAIEIAGKMVDILQPNADQAARAMLIQTMLPNLFQLQDGKGLELALPEPQKEEQKG
jgi:hypothetical protein